MIKLIAPRISVAYALSVV